MKTKFVNPMTTVATSALIEDYQTLQKAINTGDWSAVRVVMECLAETICSHTTAAYEAPIVRPSESSVIAMSAECGVIVRENGHDIRCKHGRAMSEVSIGGVCQCEECPIKEQSCWPEEGNILLENDFLYRMEQEGRQDERLLEALDKYEPRGNAQ